MCILGMKVEIKMFMEIKELIEDRREKERRGEEDVDTQVIDLYEYIFLMFNIIYNDYMLIKQLKE